MVGLSNYIKMKEESVKVQLVTPKEWNGGTITVMRFTKENIDAAFDKDVKCGFYRIGTLTPRTDSDGKIVGYGFRVCYFGRTDYNSNSLQERISDHLYPGGNTEEKNVYDDQHYFGAWECDSTMYAYYLELADYNAFFSSSNVRRIGNGYLNEECYSHNARKTTTVPQHSNKVYIDNKNRPAHP